jgi:type 1 glutamine amidotransferase
LRRTALIVRGGWDGHQPVEATDEFVPHLESHGFAVRVEGSSNVYADTAYMAGVDLIVHCMTMSTIEADELAGLVGAVRAGAGLAGWHGGIVDSYRGESDYLHMVGGQFASHPGKATSEHVGEMADYYVPHRIEMLPAATGHPITAGIEDFDLVTEQYWVLTDDYVDVLATTTQSVRSWDPWHRPVTSPAIWTREWGDGKVFVCTPGHSLDVVRHPSVKTIIERGMLWAAR